MKCKDIFARDGFAKGRWVKRLREELGPKHVREHLGASHDVYVVDDKDWYCKARFWQATGEQWIHYEPREFKKDHRDDQEGSSFFWSGKPAALASPLAMYVGYYVERGLPLGQGRPDQVKRGQEIGPTWHWNGFKRMLCEEAQEKLLFEVMDSLPSATRCIWVQNSITRKNKVFPLEGQATSVPANVEGYAGKIPLSDWIDLVAGTEFTMERCLEKQSDLVPDIFQALRVGYHLYKEVAKLMPVTSSENLA